MQNDLSPLGKMLEMMIKQGLVTQSYVPWQNSFPTARVVLPVYDSNGTGGIYDQTQALINHAQLARRTQ